MSSYKVIQDIEAEDKLIGPLTLRQSIYAGITMVCLYICFLALTKHAVFLIAMFLPVAAITGFFAFPWKGEQPTEIWALARLRFMIKPRVRVWDQSGVRDVVTVLAPRKLESQRRLTNNLSENEVRSRLKALADTIDSRGWATRNASYALYASQYQSRVNAPGQSAPTGVAVADDMFDASSNVAQNLDAMLARSSQEQRQRIMQSMAQPQAPPLPQGQQRQQMYQQPQMPQQQAPMPMTMSQSPQLPAPVMPPLPQSQLGYPDPAAAQQAMMANNLGVAPMQNMPVNNQPVNQNGQSGTQPAGQNNYWFANGPGYPGSPTTGQAPQNVVPNNPSPIPGSYAEAIMLGKISADVPIAAAATPTSDEQAFAEIARQQQETERQRYNHIRVVDPSSGIVSTPPLSVPGMIDYGRPQPTEDQMQYDTSMPQSQPSSALVAAADSVTRTPDPAILNLAKNDDLDVATIARQASKDIGKLPGGEASEVEVRLR